MANCIRSCKSPQPLFEKEGSIEAPPSTKGVGEIWLACEGTPPTMNKHKNTLPSPDPRLAQLEQRVYQLETCYKVTSLLNSELNLSNLLDTIMNVAKKVMNADACSLLLVDEETDELVFQIALSDVGEKINPWPD